MNKEIEKLKKEIEDCFYGKTKAMGFIIIAPAQKEDIVGGSGIFVNALYSVFLISPTMMYQLYIVLQLFKCFVLKIQKRKIMNKILKNQSISSTELSTNS